MADLIIKPSSGNLVLKDDQNAEKFKIATSSGNITHTGNIALGTITSGTFPDGHVLQVVQQTTEDQTACDNDGFNTTKTIFSATITPKKASSNIFLTASFAVYSNSSASYVCTDFYKNASDVTETGNMSGKTFGLTITNHSSSWSTVNQQFLDTCSENSTSEKTYKVSGRRYSTSGTTYIGWGTNMSGILTLMEIAA